MKVKITTENIFWAIVAIILIGGIIGALAFFTNIYE